MKTIIVGFSKHHGGIVIGSEAIMWFMNKPFSHTYFKYKEDLYEDFTIVHAVGKGLNYIGETRFLQHNTVVAEFALQVSDELFDELMQDCHRNVGGDYGYFQNIGILLVRSLKKIGITLSKNPINDGINCSEWLYYLLEEIYGKWTETDPNLVAPDEVYNFLLGKQNGTIK